MLFFVLDQEPLRRRIEITDQDWNRFSASISVVVVRPALDSGQLVFLKLTLQPQLPYFQEQWLDPFIKIDEELQRNLVISEHHWVCMRQMMPRKVDGNFAILVVHGLELRADNL